MKISIKAPANGPPWLPITLKSIEDWLRRIAEPQRYAKADLPPAAENTGRTVFVSDETGGATIAFSDGTDWRRVQDRNIVS